MKKVAKSAIAKFKRKRTQTRKRDSAQLLKNQCTKTSKDEGHQKTVGGLILTIKNSL